MALQISVNEFTKNIPWYRFVAGTKPSLVETIPLINSPLLASSSVMSIFPGDAVSLSFVFSSDVVYNYNFSFGTQPTGTITIALKFPGVGTEDINDFNPQSLTGSVILFSPDFRERSRVVNNTNTIMQLRIEIGVGELLPVPGGGGGAVTVSNFDDMIEAFNDSYALDPTVGDNPSRICGPTP